MMKYSKDDFSDSEELRSQPKRLFKGIGDVPPTSEKAFFVQKSTARHFATLRRCALTPSSMVPRERGNQLKNRKKGTRVHIMGEQF